MLSKEHKKKPLNEMKIHGLTEISNMRLAQKLIFDALIILVCQSGNISAEYIDVIGSGIRSLIEILFLSLLLFASFRETLGYLGGYRSIPGWFFSYLESLFEKHF